MIIEALVQYIRGQGFEADVILGIIVIRGDGYGYGWAISKADLASREPYSFFAEADVILEKVGFHVWMTSLRRRNPRVSR